MSRLETHSLYLITKADLMASLIAQDEKFVQQIQEKEEEFDRRLQAQDNEFALLLQARDEAFALLLQARDERFYKFRRRVLKILAGLTAVSLCSLLTTLLTVLLW